MTGAAFTLCSFSYHFSRCCYRVACWRFRILRYSLSLLPARLRVIRYSAGDTTVFYLFHYLFMKATVKLHPGHYMSYTDTKPGLHAISSSAEVKFCCQSIKSWKGGLGPGGRSRSPHHQVR